MACSRNHHRRCPVCAQKRSSLRCPVSPTYSSRDHTRSSKLFQQAAAKDAHDSQKKKAASGLSGRHGGEGPSKTAAPARSRPATPPSGSSAGATSNLTAQAHGFTATQQR